ncbi:hypothetical protein GmHk_11G032652 [Glycine max]|nr:hypothetical protein GmHk_11G032652 [Glycine max]
MGSSLPKVMPLWWEFNCWVREDRVLHSRPMDNFLQHSSIAASKVSNKRRKIWWTTATRPIWKLHNDIIFHNQPFHISKLVDNRNFLTWSWLRGREKDFNKSLQEKLWNAALAYESMLRQKAIVKWLKERDRNSTYFHRLINHRRRANAFQGLIIDGMWVHEPSSVKIAALNHFKDRFSEQNPNRPTLDGVQFPSLGQGEKESLWREGDLTLQDKYPSMYQVSTQQNYSINSMGHLVDNRWEWKFQWRRNFFDHEIDMVAAFMAEIDVVQIHLSSMDFLTWRADPGGSYSTKSAYNLLKDDANSVTEDSASKIIWNLKIPPRASAFSWRIFKNRLPTKANLRRRHVELPSYSCPLCDLEEENVSHVMFSCTKTRSLWWESLSWVNRVGPFPIEPKNHFMQFSH